MRRSSKLRTASRSIRTISLTLAVLAILQACKIDRSAAPEREEQPSRPVFGDEPKQHSKPANAETAKRNTPLDSEARRPNDAETLEKLPSTIKQPPTTTTQSATRADEEVASKAAPPVGYPGELEAKIDGRIVRYQPPGARVSDPGELASQTRIARQPQVAHPIVALVHRWAETLLARDLNAHMALYASALARFDGHTNVNRETVRADKQGLMATLTNVRKFEIYDLTIREDPGSGVVVAVFRTEWQTSNHSNSSRAAWYRLTCRRSGSSWQTPRSRRPSGTWGPTWTRMIVCGYGRR
jgi:ketosteroid isomerase-like protein